MDVPWVGVKLADIAALVMPKSTATHIICYGYDKYTTNISIEEALKDDVLLVHSADNKPLERDHGGPVRMITPQLYAWKGAKWINRIEFLNKNKPGFWEVGAILIRHIHGEMTVIAEKIILHSNLILTWYDICSYCY